MFCKCDNLDLIDLISEYNVLLRRLTEQAWNESSNIHITNSEWFIIANIYKNNTTISNVTKNVDISRQATHKFTKNLESKGLVEVYSSDINKRDKCIRLTKFGEECFDKYTTLKGEIEEKIACKIGNDRLDTLKDILRLNWVI
ncbi:MAG: MarR family winged helix-turn-helix transcriptional regulator [Clostridium sp.]